jgi:hypothetical protein
MRTLKLHFSKDAIPTLDTFLKRTKEGFVANFHLEPFAV